MATMLNGAAVMDAVLLLIAGNETCPQPQTSEHLAAIEIMKLRHIVILQNKIDLVKEAQAKEQSALLAAQENEIDAAKKAVEARERIRRLALNDPAGLMSDDEFVRPDDK